MLDKLKTLGKDALIYGLGGMVSKFIGFFLLPIFTRVFNPSDYGIMDVIATMTALAGIVLTAGTETALSFYFFKYREPDEQRKTVTSTAVYLLGINAVVAVVVWFLADKISLLTFDTSNYSVYLRVAILSLPLGSLVGLHLNVLRLQRKPWAYTSFSISQLLLTVFLNIYLVVILRTGIIGVFWTNLAMSGLFAMIGIIVNRSYMSIAALSRRRLAEVLRYGLPLVIGGLSMWSINSIDRFFLVNYSTLDQVGLYSVGIRLASVVGFITWAFRLANAPFQFEISYSKDAPQIYARTLTYFVLITSLVCVPLALFAKPILRLLTREAYLGANIVVGLAAYSAVAYGMYQIIGVGLLITKKTLFTSVAISIGAIANVIFLFLLVPPFGMLGAAVSVLLTHAAVLTILYIGAQRAYPVPYDLKRISTILVFAGIVIGVRLIINTNHIVVEILSASGLFIAYLTILTLSPVFTSNEKRILFDTFKRIITVLRTEHLRV